MIRLADARILHLFANYKWTGPADPAIRAAARLRQRGLDVAFAQAAFVHSGNRHDVADQLFRWRLPVLTGLQLRKHFHVPSLLRDTGRLRTLLERERIAIVHCHLPGDHFLAALASRRLAEPPRIVRTLYDPEAPPRGWRERFAFRRTGVVLAPTPAARDGVRQRFGMNGNQVRYLDPVTEPRVLEGPDARAKFGLDASHKIVGITARIQPHRRFELLWEIARRVVDAVPAARFVLLGRGNDEDTKAHVTEPIARLGLGRHVVLPGYQRGPDYDAALRALDAFLFLVPGSDGTCRAVTDAMAFGLPVVATDRGILPALLAPRRPDELPGRACPESAEEMAGELIALLQDDDLRAARGAAALRVARTEMNPAHAAAVTAELYERLLEGPL
ncbi:MAG: glycosyltransferase [bacterium]|nr:glycosyltransferase [bacterium]